VLRFLQGRNCPINLAVCAVAAAAAGHVHVLQWLAQEHPGCLAGPDMDCLPTIVAAATGQLAVLKVGFPVASVLLHSGCLRSAGHGLRRGAAAAACASVCFCVLHAGSDVPLAIVGSLSCKLRTGANRTCRVEA
jgi:hypothetical protein